MKHFVVGLTGPIGAGKSVVRALFQEMGAACIDTDLVSRQVVLPGSDCLRELAQAFGEDILNADGTLNRKALASVAFSNEESKKRLNSITHPYIGEETKRQIEEIPENRMVVVEATLLFGSFLEAMCDVTVAVVADDDLRLQRILARDQAGEPAARARMEAQPSCLEYRRLAHYTVVNNKGLDELRQQAQWLYERFSEACQ